MPWRASGTVDTWAARPIGVQSCPDPPCPTSPHRRAPHRRAPPHPDPPVVRPCSRTRLARKGFTQTNKRRHIGQQPGTKSGRRPVDKLDINRCSTAGFVPPSVYIGLPLFMLPKKRSGQCLRFPRKQVGRLSSGEPTRRRPVLPGPAPPRRSAVCRLAPTRPWYVCPGFGLDKSLRR